MDRSTQTQELYRPLDASRKQIRLIMIESQNQTTWWGRPKETFAYHLITVSLDDNPNFTALSYVWSPWASKGELESINVDGQDVSVTKSLASALMHVKGVWRQTFPDRDPCTFRLWADAVCINQSDLQETASQVALMESVYGRAEIVIGWLPPRPVQGGSGWERRWQIVMKVAMDTVQALDERIEHAVGRKLKLSELIHALDTDSRLNDASAASTQTLKLPEKRRWRFFTGAPRWATEPERALHELRQSEYWKRVWISQEIILAQRLIVATPQTTIPFEAIARVALWKGRFVPQPTRGKNDYINFHNQINYSGQAWAQVSRAIELKEARQSGVSVAELVALSARTARFAEATNPRDYIYGLLGINRLPIAVDYEKPYEDVLHEYFSKYLETQKSTPRGQGKLGDCELALLTYAGTFDRYSSSPSWLPSFEGNLSYNEFATHNFPEWQAGTNITHRAAGSLMIQRQSLWVTGIDLGRVRYLSERTIDWDCGMYELKKHDLPEASENPLSMSKFADYYSVYISNSSHLSKSGLPPLRAFFRACMGYAAWRGDLRRELRLGYCFLASQYVFNQPPGVFLREFLLSHEIQGAGEVLEDFEQELDDPAILRDTMRALGIEGWTTWKSYGLFMTADGYLGRCPVDGTMEKEGKDGVREEHDEFLFILFGYTAPVLLRRIEEHYVLVGSCYVDGLMRGEVQELLQSGKRCLTSLEIR